jgi:hypothetical protein
MEKKILANLIIIVHSSHFIIMPKGVEMGDSCSKLKRRLVAAFGRTDMNSQKCGDRILLGEIFFSGIFLEKSEQYDSIYTVLEKYKSYI